MANKISVCSSRKRVNYFWRECTGSHVAEHVAETVAKLMEIVESRHQLNDYQSALCEAAFEDRLDAARRGRLVPGDHVKTVQYEPLIDMFEMRWADLAVTPRDPLTGLYGDEVYTQMRLYYVEEGQRWVVGLYCHEKEILDTKTATDAAQDAHIACAVQFHDANAHRAWGAPVRSLASAT